MARSARASTRAQLVRDLGEEMRFFMFGCLSHRKNPNGVAALGVGDDGRAAFEQSHGEKSCLAVVQPIICDRESKPIEERVHAGEVDGVFAQIGAALGFVPLEPHRSCVVTNRRYVNLASPMAGAAARRLR